MRRQITLVQRIVAALALLSALIASTALAAPKTVNLLLNTVNVSSALTTVTASLAAPVLRLSNTGSGPALALNVPASQTPMEVSAGAAKVANLDADRLDGRDASDFAMPLYVRYRDAGFIEASYGVTSVEDLGGVYRVAFDRDINNCAVIGGLGQRGPATRIKVGSIFFHPTDIDSPVYTVDVWLFDDDGPVSFSDFSVVAYCAGQ
jgi:hypothetical protein